MMQDHSYMAATSGRHESIDTSMVTAFDESDPLNVRRSTSYSSCSTQSQSPPLHSQFSGIDIPQLQTFTNPFTNTLEQISPVTATSSSRRDSDDESQRAEVGGHSSVPRVSSLTTRQRRRAQNRAAQRAYRQRKDQSLKQREREIESLREELDKAQRLNRTLCKVVAVLRERIKNPEAEPEET